METIQEDIKRDVIEISRDDFEAIKLSLHFYLGWLETDAKFSHPRAKVQRVREYLSNTINRVERLLK